MESEENKEQDTTCIQASTADPNSVETLHCFQLSYFARAAARALRRLRY